MSARGRRATQLDAKRRSRLWVGGGALAAAVVVLTVILVLARPGPAAPVHTDGEPYMGAEDAPVTVFYYADFQCPYCREFELGGAFDRLKATYIDAGTVRFVVKDFPIIGDDSDAAARASQYVWETAPETYWPWHRGLYERQGAERSGWAAPDRLVAYSSQFSAIDLDGLRAAMQGGPIADEVRADEREGSDHGVRSTPTLLIAGRTVPALDTGAVDAAIRDALAAGSG